MKAYRYATNLVDQDGVTVCVDLCRRCADGVLVMDIDGPIDAPEVDIVEGYVCDECGRNISL